MIRNPVLKGFNADPSFLRVGEDYYLAVSTFEWYPGVQIHHSRGLVNWRLVSRPLDREALLDMRGNADSCGVWAPCLSHDGERFWLVYTDVKRLDGNFKDAHNYITCSETIDGPWSDPWYVNSSGFDPSLFHDDDGRKWFVNQQWNHRGPGTGGNPAHASFDGILLQEWSPEEGLIGEAENIFPGSDRGLTEAPHLFKRDGYYYLTTAEGGTGYDHAVTMARSRDIHGPYELHPETHLISTKGTQGPIQRTGHGQYVETHWGDHYHSFLMGRPMPGRDGTGRYCPMGRETGLEKVVWKDGWLWLEEGGTVPRTEVPAPVDVAPEPEVAIDYGFDAGLPMDFQWLRTPAPERIFRTGDGALTLFGRESLGSWFEQALVARRQEHFAYTAETEVDFAPTTYQQAAGLTTYYNRHKFHALLVTDEPGIGRVLTILSCPGDWPEQRLSMPAEPVALADGPVEMRVVVDHAEQQFWYRQGGDWQPFGPALDASVISDEGGRGEHASFTGAFVGMVAMDTSGRGREARFSRFRYAPAGT
ncbi:glycoside hydrolase family 43 protein [Pelagovum pacificum]|uniref:Glycoside hydrolase family 43 protein n=1 Tax=Pelagovum pacificum TaxID=2588711 RepID=A0A5C5GEB5_9RHOB|nr:glycoside hydrolase family 43 protein [Pelagovum pacificum]QQA43755.1 glycoside hydrolase family 43 protein [Pelagovum pacificum]TNY33115.1 glycoside hydrolase family 43 protein [Pelagovum pacificum]